VDYASKTITDPTFRRLNDNLAERRHIHQHLMEDNDVKKEKMKKINQIVRMILSFCG
jgi:hypothetical protein